MHTENSLIRVITLIFCARRRHKDKRSTRLHRLNKLSVQSFREAITQSAHAALAPSIRTATYERSKVCLCVIF